MKQRYNFQNEYSPFVMTQIYEDQNRLILPNYFILNNYSQFNCMIYKYLDRKPPDSSFYRIFRIKEKVSLLYYWKSDLREPRSNRQGIYLIIGVLCDYSVYCRNPLHLEKAFIYLLNLIMEKYSSNNCDEIISKIWEEESSSCFPPIQLSPDIVFDTNCHSLMAVQPYQHTMNRFAEINDEFLSGYYQYILDNIVERYEKKVRFGICHLYLCMQSGYVEDILPLFVSEVANWMCHPCGKMDIASIEGYGESFINISLNSLKLPKDMKQVRIFSRFNKMYLEIVTF